MLTTKYLKQNNTNRLTYSQFTVKCNIRIISKVELKSIHYIYLSTVSIICFANRFCVIKKQIIFKLSACE